MAELIPDIVSQTIWRQLRYLFLLNRNIKNLEHQLKMLVTMRDGLQLRVHQAKRNGELIRPDVVEWINRVAEIIAEVERVIEKKEEMRVEGSCLRWCLTLKSRYLLSKKAEEIGVVMDELQDRGFFDRISYPVRIESVVSTTMVKDVAMRAKNASLFDEIVMAVVSQSPNLKNIQGQIADNLGLKLQEETLFGRAGRLRQRLANGTRILIVLDDIWALLDLQKIGIPLWGENRGCKIVLTSRNLDVCREMGTQKNITLKTLTREEAWHLFKETVGDSVDALDMQTIAEQVVNECQGLPLALLAVGRALKHKSTSVWTDTLRRLRIPGEKSTLGVNTMVYQALVLSYNYLEDEEAKSLFLLCCLYPEDYDIQIEDLVRFGMGLQLFVDINELGEARDRVRALVDLLKSCYLLLDSDKNEHDCVKMHDVVRDVGISIASESKGKNAFLIRHGDSLREWPKKHTYENYTSISVISGNIIELPEGLRCPQLRMLLLACTNDSLKTPHTFFDGMRELQVLMLDHISIPLLPSSLQFVSNLHTFCLQGCKLENMTIIGELLNLQILSFRGSSIEELPKEIGRLANLRLLDLTGCNRLERITPGVISGLVLLEELYMMRSFSNWETDEGERTEERRNASLRELQSLSHLRILEIYIPDPARLPTNPLFTDLTQYKIRIGDDAWWSVFPFRKHLLLKLNKSIALHGGISMLLTCTELLSLKGKGSRNVVHQLVQDGVQHLKELSIESCDMLMCLADTMDLSLEFSDAIFPILESLKLDGLCRLKEICRGRLPAGSFGKLRTLKLQILPSLTHFLVEDLDQGTVSLHNLRYVELYRCDRLRNLFSLSMARELVQLQHLQISHCNMMEEVVSEGSGEDGHATNMIEFPRLEYMALTQLEGFTGFSRGIDEIKFPQLKILHMRCLPKIMSFFPNKSTWYSDENCNATLQSVFPQKVAFPSLEELELGGLPNASDLW